MRKIVDIVVALLLFAGIAGAQPAGVSAAIVAPAPAPAPVSAAPSGMDRFDQALKDLVAQLEKIKNDLETKVATQAVEIASLRSKTDDQDMEIAELKAKAFDLEKLVGEAKDEVRRAFLAEVGRLEADLRSSYTRSAEWAALSLKLLGRDPAAHGLRLELAPAAPPTEGTRR